MLKLATTRYRIPPLLQIVRMLARQDSQPRRYFVPQLRSSSTTASKYDLLPFRMRQGLPALSTGMSLHNPYVIQMQTDASLEPALEKQAHTIALP